MISVYKIKPAFQKLLQPLMNGLYKMGVTPNAITVFSIFFSFGLGVLVYYHLWKPYFLLLVPAGLLLRMVFNALDGMMAKQHNMQSKLGEVLNELGDVLSDVFIIFPFVMSPYLAKGWVFLFAFLAVINEFVGVLGKAMGGERRYEGPMGKSDRALFIGLFCLLTYFWKGFWQFQNEAFIGAIVLVIISTTIRIVKGVK